MRHQFILTDRLGNDHEISEPQGFDGCTLNLKRDEQMHGLFFDFQGDSFTYARKAARLLQAEYEAHGFQGQMTLTIRELCGGKWETLYTGRFLFAKYKRLAGAVCSVQVPLESTGALMKLRNRMDQKVDLLTAQAFDGSALPAYAGLGTEVSIPSKGIPVADHAAMKVEATYTHDGRAGSGTVPYFLSFFVPSFDNDIAKEIGGFAHDQSAVPDYEYNHIAANGTSSIPQIWAKLPYAASALDRHTYFPHESITPIINYDRTLGNTFDDNPIAVNLTGRFIVSIAPHGSIGSNPLAQIYTWNLYLGILKANSDPLLDSSWNWISNNAADWQIVPFTSYSSSVTSAAGSINFDVPVTLNPGDRVYYFYTLDYKKNDYLDDSYGAFKFVNAPLHSFRAAGISYVPPTAARLFLPNEAWSRVTEAITDGQMRVYSDYFGRTDSLPYTAAQDGCGSLDALTSGQWLRYVQLFRPGQLPLFALSFKDLWEGFNPMHCLGAGVEPDPLRPGFDRVRIESWPHFYADDVAFECFGVDNLTITANEKLAFSQVSAGYDKWEAQEFSGIDEFLTKRQYRTELSEIKNTLTVVSSFVASGYAIESIRRKRFTSEDSPFDKETFIICLKRVTGNLEVEQGGILSAGNIADPDTILNYRRSPVRNLLKWLPIALASYRPANVDTSLQFTESDGNPYAAGNHNTAFCKPESGLISENDPITPTLLADPTQGLPVWYPEDITYEYPMNAAQFRSLRAKSYDLVYYETEGVFGYGWLMNLVYKPQAGTAEFTVKPRR